MTNNWPRAMPANNPAVLLLALLTITVTTGAALLTGCARKVDNGAPSPTVTPNNVTLTQAERQHIHLYTARSSKFRKTIDANGTVDFDNDQATGVLAPISGPVSRLLVSLGDEVKAGQPLAIVDSPDFAAALSAYRKALATAQTSRRLADLDKDLIQHHGVSQREADQAETDATNAEADRDAALQELASLKVDPQIIKDIEKGHPIARVDAIIRAPIAGTVVEKLITPGELLQAGATACFTIADLSRVWVMAQVFGSDVASIALGDPAEVVTGIEAKTLPGKVGNISPLVDPDTRAVVVRVVVDNPGKFLKKQMYVHALIQASEESTGLLVPVSAILRDDEKLPFVYVAQSDGSFAREHVTLGYRAGDQYEIATGLNTGEQIVVEGGIFVQFMQNQ
jgi:cobalt-zinc-cadmium efflux system membrane fusion protein